MRLADRSRAFRPSWPKALIGPVQATRYAGGLDFLALRQAKSAENPSPPVLPGRGRSHQGMAPYGGDGGSCSGTKGVRKGRERSFDSPRWGKARNVARFPRVGMLAQDDRRGRLGEDSPGAPSDSRLAGDRRLPPPPRGEARAWCGTASG